MGLRICVADTDKRYLQKLVGELEKQQRGDSYTLCSSAEKLAEILARKEFDILVFSEDVFTEELPLSQVSLPIVFVDETERTGVYFQEFAKVKKYQRISGIYNQICQLFSEKTDRRSVHSANGTSSIIVCYSPIGGSGKSSVALALAKRLAISGRSCLYLDFEPIPTDMEYFNSQDAGGLSEIFATMGNKVDFGMKLKSLMRQSGEIKYISHFESPHDIYALQNEEIQEFMECLRQDAGVEWIVMDLDTSLGQCNATVMKEADFVVLIAPDRPADEERIRHFFAQHWLVDELEYKMHRVKNMCRELGVADEGAELISIGIHRGNFEMGIQGISQSKGMEVLVRRLGGA